MENMEYGLGDCVDIMIPRTDLLEKNKAIKSLELRIQQQVAEFHYQIKQGEALHSEKMRDIHREYCDVIEELKVSQTSSCEKRKNIHSIHLSL
jgi:cilia- and flagella-associated protein 57